MELKREWNYREKYIVAMHRHIYQLVRLDQRQPDTGIVVYTSNDFAKVMDQKRILETQESDIQKLADEQQRKRQSEIITPNQVVS